MIKETHFTILLAFFLCVTSFLTSQAQTDSGAVSTAVVKRKKTEASYQAVSGYIQFSSETLFSSALKAKTFTANLYSIVSIIDTVAGVPRKKCGVVQANKIVIPFDYDSIQYTTGSEFICRKHLVARRFYACYYYIYNTSTKKVIDYNAPSIQYIGNSLYVIRAKGRQFFYNSSTTHTSPSFDSYQLYDSLFILINTASEYQLLDRSGNDFIATPFKVLLKNDSIYNAVLYDEWDIYKNSGEKVLSKLRCDSLRISSEKYSWDIYRNDCLYYRKDIPYILDTAKAMESSPAFGPVTIIDKSKYDTLKLMIHFDSIYYQSDNLLMYRKAGKYGYCDTTGNIKIAHQYDTITAWHDNMAAIRLKNKWGYVTKRELLTVQPYYITALPFNNGVAAVFDGKRWMFVTKEGKNINSVTFDSIQQTISGKWYVYNKGLIGLCDTNGRELIPPVYEFLLDANSDVFVFKKEFLYGLIAKDRIILCPPVYDRFIYDTTNNYYLLKHLSETPLLFVISVTK